MDEQPQPARASGASESPDRKRVGGRYELLRLIGRGGMGEVHAARNVGTGRDVAIKMIRSSDISSEQKRRFLREAKAATAIEHPNVIEILDVFEDDDGTPVMVMELLRGRSLAAMRVEAGPISLTQAATLLVPVLDALRAAHDKGIVHRDLKPDNIFLNEGPDGLVPKVLDFGIAKLLDPTAISAETQGAPTHTGSLLGTPHYMSFEQAMSEKDIDQRSDVWSMGVILFELLTGRRPLEFQNLGGMYAAFLQGSVPSIREHLPELPESVAAIVDRCLVKERAGRLNALGELIDVLEPLVDLDSLEPLRAPSSGDGGPTATTTGRRLGSRGRPRTTATGQAQLSDPLSASSNTQQAFAGDSMARSRRSRPLWLLGVAVAIALGAGALVVLVGPTRDTDSAQSATSLPATLPSAEPSAEARLTAATSTADGSVGQARSTDGNAPQTAAPGETVATAKAAPVRVTKGAVSPAQAPVGSAPSATATVPQETTPPAERKPKGIVDPLPY